MDKETAFALARQMIDGLPCRREVIDFWDMPRIEANTDRVKWTDAANQLAALAREAPADVAVYFQIWASDAAVGAGDLENGLAFLPLPDLGERASLRASNSLDLKLSLAIPPSARDITALFGPRVTKFGKENLSAVERYIQIQLDERATQGVSPSIGTWTADAHEHKAGYSLFNGHASYIVTRPPGGWDFSYSKEAEKACLALIRDAENTWREESDLPRVGEGWVSETRLYYELKAAFAEIDVIQHHRPDWLGRQHLDVAIPALRVAIEFHGTQHDKPVAFFGGEEAYTRTQERDRRKLRKCTKQGWRMIYVREGYDFAGLVANIVATP